ncbi:histidine kinase [Sulfuricella denitrificans skB26]|uniref:histidine kinase n=1 Tax=Sulfuricella denitrificans (strain DSM 22764 / NBRC 105220 / skB26) TaxID=1163617 RepID=S6AAH4_SULDS|nr:sensor histidine kinase [Sulfuricella denitrificans]BAN35865.1 histidine kinase [Sulfuricella denitrificans skB26]
MKIYPNRLHYNLLVWLLVPLITLFAARSAYTYFVTAPDLSARVYDRALEDLAKSLTQYLVIDQDGVPSLHLPETASQLLMADDSDQIFFSVSDHAGRVLAGNGRLLPSSENLRVHRNSVFFDGTVNGEKVRAVTLTQIPALDRQDLFISISFAETLNKRKLLAQDIFNSSLQPQAMLILLASLTVWLGISKGLQSLRVLKRDLAQRSHLDLSPVDSNLAPEEIRPIIDTVNDLMERLKRVLEGQSRFAGDAAHQLRTPLAGLKAQLELVSRQTSTDDVRTELKPLMTGCDRMCRLVNQLLAMARNEHESSQAKEFGIVDLNALAAEMTKEWVSEAYRKKIDLGFVGSPLTSMVMGDSDRLREMVTNLIHNAICYTPPGGQVTVSVVADPPALIVEDNGDGIPPEERQKVFERFYRVLGSRAEGSGLGLSIVQEIALAHKASVQLDANVQGKGTVAKVIFPAR